MKYIRTKDEIIDLRRFGNMPCGVANYMGKVVYDFNAYGRFVVEKEADTVEELCDEFVRVKRETKAIIDIARAKIKEDTEYYRSKNFDIYGAIWTDKGLIFVAKMNDKGELELL